MLKDTGSLGADFLCTDRTGNVCLVNLQLATVVFTDKIADVFGIIGSAVYHRQKNTFDFQLGIDLPWRRQRHWHGYATMQKILYVDKKPVSSYEITALESDEWVIEGYDTSFREYARRYISSQPTEETKYTGVVYETVEYYKLDSNGLPQKIKYVNGAPSFEEPEYVEGLGYIEEAWVIADDYEYGTYKEYAVLHNYGVKDETKTKYTGVIKEVIEWKVEGYSKTYPYYQYERKYINGNRTAETRNTYPAVTDPSKKQSAQTSQTQQSTTTTTTPVQPEPEVVTPVQPQPDYINPDGTINFSKLKLEYWYDAENREYKIWYDSDGNEVTRFATGAYKVERNKK